MDNECQKTGNKSPSNERNDEITGIGRENEDDVE